MQIMYLIWISKIKNSYNSATNKKNTNKPIQKIWAEYRTSLAVQWLRLYTSTAGGIVRPLVRELRFHMQHGMAKKEKMSRRLEQTFFQGRHTDGQQVHEKTVNITNHQGTANQNHNAISELTYQNGSYQKDKK